MSDKPRVGSDLPKMSTPWSGGERVVQPAAGDAAVGRPGDRGHRGAARRDRTAREHGDRVHSDNGLFYGEHRIPRATDPAYPASSHLPLVVAGPGSSPRKVDRRPRFNVDSAPTFWTWPRRARHDADGRRVVAPSVPPQATPDRGPDAVHPPAGSLTSRSTPRSGGRTGSTPATGSPTAPSGSSSTTSSRIGTCSGTCIGTRPTTRARRLCAARWRRWPGMSSRGGPPTRTDAG